MTGRIREADESAATTDRRTLRGLERHVSAILDLAAVPSRDRDDLHEELHSHLYERWSALVRSGLSAGDAANEAIASFGDVPTLAQDLAAAYHSRLYMRTIGVLVPLVPLVGANVSPVAAGNVAAYLVLVACYDLVAGLLYAAGLSPARALTALAATALAVAFNLLAARALDLGQRWALRYAQVLIPVVLVLGAIGLFSSPQNFLAVVAAIISVLVLPSALGAQAAGWVAASRTIDRPLMLGLTVVLAASVAGFGFAAAVPDPTQVGPNGLDLTVSLECTRAGATVTTDIAWSRTDLWPNGPLGSTTEFVFVFVDDGAPGSPWSGSLAPSSSTTVIDIPPGNASPRPAETIEQAPEYAPATWGWMDDGTTFAIRTGSLQAGHRYRLTTTTTVVKRAAVRYHHASGADRSAFAKRAEVGCGGTAEGVRVPMTATLP